jgi:hypothetical protein
VAPGGRGFRARAPRATSHRDVANKSHRQILDFRKIVSVTILFPERWRLPHDRFDRYPLATRPSQQPRASIAHHQSDLDSSEEGKEERWLRGRRNPLKRLNSRKERSCIFLPLALIFLPQDLVFPSPGLDFPSPDRMLSATGKGRALSRVAQRENSPAWTELDER